MLVNGFHKEFIRTTIAELHQNTCISVRSIKAALSSLNKSFLIYIGDYSVDKIRANTPINIVLTYQDIYYTTNRAYKALPQEFVLRLLPNVTPKEFAIYCVLVNYFRYFMVGEKYNHETGVYEYYYKELGYAFPSQRKIAEAIGMDYHYIHQYVKLLAKKKLITYEASSQNNDYRYSEDGKVELLNPNYRYRVNILQRLEYAFFNIIHPSIPDKRETEIKLKVKQKGFEKLAQSKVNNRVEYCRLKEKLRAGDVLIVTDLDRLGRNADDIIKELKELKESGIKVVALDMPYMNEWNRVNDNSMYNMIIDIVVTIKSHIAEQEREKIVSRINQGLAVAKAEGKKLGRPKVELPDNFVKEYKKFKNGSYGDMSATAFAKVMGIARPTLYKYVKILEDEQKV